MRKKAFFTIIAVGMIAVFMLFIPVFYLMITGVVAIEPVKFSEELAKGTFDLFRLVFSIALGSYLLGFLKEGFLKTNKKSLIATLQQKCTDIIKKVNQLESSIIEMDAEKLILWQKQFHKFQVDLGNLVNKIPRITSEEPDSVLDNILKSYKPDIEGHFKAITRAVEEQDGIISQSKINEVSILHLQEIKNWCEEILNIENQ